MTAQVANPTMYDLEKKELYMGATAFRLNPVTTDGQLLVSGRSAEPSWDRLANGLPVYATEQHQKHMILPLESNGLDEDED